MNKTIRSYPLFSEIFALTKETNPDPGIREIAMEEWDRERETYILTQHEFYNEDESIFFKARLYWKCTHHIEPMSHDYIGSHDIDIELEEIQSLRLYIGDDTDMPWTVRPTKKIKELIYNSVNHG